MCSNMTRKDNAALKADLGITSHSFGACPSHLTSAEVSPCPALVFLAQFVVSVTSHDSSLEKTQHSSSKHFALVNPSHKVLARASYTRLGPGINVLGSQDTSSIFAKPFPRSQRTSDCPSLTFLQRLHRDNLRAWHPLVLSISPGFRAYGEPSHRPAA